MSSLTPNQALSWARGEHVNDLITLPRAGDRRALERDEVLRQLDDRTNQTWVGKRARWARLVRAQAEEIERLRAALEQADPGSVDVKRSRMESLSKALGNPTQLAAKDGDTADDALVELAASRLEQPEQEPVAWMSPNGELRKDRAPRKFTDWGWRQEDYKPLYAHPPRREPLTVTELQQALVDVLLVDPDAIDDPEGYDGGMTLIQIDALHKRLTEGQA